MKWVGLLLALTLPAAAEDSWISHPDAAAHQGAVVMHLRRVLYLATVPRSMPVTVTADNRFILYVNGNRVGAGPSTGTVQAWRTEAIDLAPHLHAGRNVVAAVVWDYVRSPMKPGAPLPEASQLPPQFAPIAQQSAGLGFRLASSMIGTDVPGWRVKIDEGRAVANGRAQVPRGRYYVASAPEVINAAKSDWAWAGPQEGEGWTDAVPVAVARPLISDTLPQQNYKPSDPGRVVRSDMSGAEAFPAAAITIPASRHVRILLQRDAMVSGYPELSVSGGAGATIKLSYAEGLYDDNLKKADRNLVGNRKVLGIFDTFLADGQRRSFLPLWWRTWRYAELDIQTAGAPLTLESLHVHETGYPFQQVAQFRSSDPRLNRIWDIGWRTAQVDAHETYMDSAYWEQLQYTGDTRLQMLISYAVSGDPRLAAQAIDAFAESSVDDGLEQGAYPSRSNNVIATFSLAWIGMLADWSMQQPDKAMIVRNLPRMRTILHWFEPWLMPNGLLGKNPQWNFIDWVNSANDRKMFPSYGKDGGSCLMTVTWLGALRQASALEAANGDKAQAAWDAEKADTARSAIRAHCWDAARGLYADNADFTLYSQHMNALAVLYDVATPGEALNILNRITEPGHGIDAPPGMFTTSYYFAWYLVRAFQHAGLSDRYPALLKTWRELLALNYTTWPESRGETRSDTHAWSAHPTADLLGIVAGIQPDAPGYARLKVAPVLGDLTRLDACAATPSGPVVVHYKVTGSRLIVDIDKPAGMPGIFVWQGARHPLMPGRNHFVVSR